MSIAYYLSVCKCVNVENSDRKAPIVFSYGNISLNNVNSSDNRITNFFICGLLFILLYIIAMLRLLDI